MESDEHSEDSGGLEIGEKDDGGFDLNQFGTGRKALALYAYAAAKSDELSFEEGTIVELITTPDEGWWEGRVEDRFGWFPSTYVEEFEGEPPATEPKVEEPKVIEKLPTDKEIRSGAFHRTSLEESNPEFRQCVLDEIVESEYKYTVELETFLKRCSSNLRDSASIPDPAKKVLFANLFRIVQLHNQFYERLTQKELDGEDPQFGCLFLSSLPRFYPLYTKYFTTHPMCIEVFRRYKNDEAFEALFKDEKGGVMIVPYMLNRPIQRLEKYPTLLKELARHTTDDHPDKKTLLQALNGFSRMVSVMKNKQKMKEFERVLTGSELEGIHLNALLALGDLEFFLTVLGRAKDGLLKEKVVVLFQHNLCMFSRGTRTTGKVWYRLREKYALTDVVVAALDDDDSSENAFSLVVDRKTVIVLLASSLAERDEAVTVIQQAIDNHSQPEVKDYVGLAAKKTLSQRLNRTWDLLVNTNNKDKNELSPTFNRSSTADPEIQRSKSGSSQLTRLSSNGSLKGSTVHRRTKSTEPVNNANKLKAEQQQQQQQQPHRTSMKAQSLRLLHKPNYTGQSGSTFSSTSSTTTTNNLSRPLQSKSKNSLSSSYNSLSPLSRSPSEQHAGPSNGATSMSSQLTNGPAAMTGQSESTSRKNSESHPAVVSIDSCNFTDEKDNMDVTTCFWMIGNLQEQMKQVKRELEDTQEKLEAESRARRALEDFVEDFVKYKE